MKPEISVVFPAFNEADNIIKVLEESMTHLKTLGSPWEILVVDNASTDQTATIVKQFIEKNPEVRLIQHDENKLYSGSCQTALENATGTYTAIIDSDGQYTVADLPKFIAKIKEGANLVVGWRKNRQDPVARLIMAGVFNRMGKFYLKYPHHDLNCGFRVFDEKFRKKTTIKHRINLSNPEFYVRARLGGFIVEETDIQHFHRIGGKSIHSLWKLGQIFLEVHQYFKTLHQELTGH